MRWVCGVIVVLLVGCQPAPPPPIAPVTPTVKPYKVKSDLSNVENTHLLGELTDTQKESLATNAFFVTDSDDLDFYQAYQVNPAPFITTDSVLHAYYTLLNDSLVATGRARYGPKMQSMLEDAREELAQDTSPAAIRALAYLDQALGTIRSPRKWRSIEIYEELVANAQNRHHALLTSLRYQVLPVAEEEVLRAALLLSARFAESDEFDDYRALIQLTLDLAGSAEDPGPLDLLDTAKELKLDLSGSGTLEAADCARVRKHLAKRFTPSISDEARPSPGLRLLPPGVTLKSLRFQRIGESRYPTGDDLLALLDEGTAEKSKDQSLHTRCLRLLNLLPKSDAKGYPSLYHSQAWAEKRDNTQLAAWAELEHAVAPLTKDNANYLGGFHNTIQFHGYVEPAPKFYRELRAITRQTRERLEPELKAVERERKLRDRALTRRVYEDYDKIMADLNFKKGGHPEGFLQLLKPGPVPTAEHFRRLEQMLHQLEEISAWELTEQPFTEKQIASLARYGSDLKYLAIEASTGTDTPPEPCGVVVPIFTEHASQTTRYAATGRPLKIVAVVPYEGKLFASVGAVYSYYEFNRPGLNSLNDQVWKDQVRLPVTVQPESPRLGGNLKSRPISKSRLQAWLGRPEADWYGSIDFVYEINGREVKAALMELGSLELSKEALLLARREFVNGSPDWVSLIGLYYCLQGDRKVGIEALRHCCDALAADPNLDPIRHRWRLPIVLSLRLINGTQDAETEEVLRRIEEFYAPLQGPRRYDPATYIVERVQELRKHGTVSNWSDER